MPEGRFEDWMADLPEAVRAAIDTQDADAFQQAMDALSTERARAVLDMLQAKGIVGVGPAPEEEMGEVLAELDGVLGAIADVAKGECSQRDEVEAVLPRLEQTGWRLNGVAQRIWDGERNLANLTAGLDPNSARLVENIFERITGKPVLVRVDQFEAEALEELLPLEVVGAVEAQDEDAYQQALQNLSPSEQVMVESRLEALQAHTDAQLEAAQELLATYPQELRQAVIDQDADALQEALDRLPEDQAQIVLEQLRQAGLVREMSDRQIARLMDEFDPMLGAIALSAGGEAQTRPQIEDLIDDLETQGLSLREAVHRVWAGERDLAVLTAGLDKLSARMVQRILEYIAKPPGA